MVGQKLPAWSIVRNLSARHRAAFELYQNWVLVPGSKPSAGRAMITAVAASSLLVLTTPTSIMAKIPRVRSPSIALGFIM